MCMYVCVFFLIWLLIWDQFVFTGASSSCRHHRRQSSSGSSSFYLWCRAESLRVTWLSWGDSRPAGHFSFRCRPARNTWLEELFHFFFFFGGGDRWEDPSAEINSSSGAARKGRDFTQPHIEWKESQYLQVRNVQHGRKVAAALKLFAVLSTSGAPAQPWGWSVREVSGVHSLIIMSS